MNLLPVRTAQTFCKVLEHDGGGHSVVAVKRERLEAKNPQAVWPEGARRNDQKFR
jgi:hypothetical protein